MTLLDDRRAFKSRYSSDGLHLFDRNSGTNILLDELKLPQTLWSKAPRQISIALTNTCDLSCEHCYAPKHKAVLNFGELVEWLKVLDANGCLGVGFGGGEPTIYPRFAELCCIASKETALALSMTTHGHRLTSDLLEKLSSCLHFIRVSMDGVGATYEDIRKRSFSDLLSRIKQVGDIFPFGINYVVNSKTIHDLDRASKLAADLGAKELLLLPEEAVGRGSGIAREAKDKLRAWIEQYQGSVKLAVSERHAEGLPICQPFIHEKSISAYLHIDANGRLKKSSYETSGIQINQKGLLNAIDMLRVEEREAA